MPGVINFDDDDRSQMDLTTDREPLRRKIELQNIQPNMASPLSLAIWRMRSILR